MTEDQGKPRGPEQSPDDDREQDDAQDLRALFRATAPSAPAVDVEALFAAAQSQLKRRRFLWNRRRLIGPLQDFSGRAAAPDVPLVKSFRKRSLSMFLRIAAGVLVVAAVATPFVTRRSAAGVTLAEVQATVERTQTMTCTLTDKRVPPSKDGDESSRLLIRGSSLVRFEQADGGYTITDFSRHKCVLVDPAHKSVRILEGLAIPRNAGVVKFYEMFREIAANPVKTLPSREIAGKKAVGFVARNPILEGFEPATKGPKPEITVWVDPETKLPLQIETTMQEDDGVISSQIVSNIIFDRPLAAALFDLTPPAGYQVESFGVAQLQPEPVGKDAKELVATPRDGIGPVKFGMKTDEVIKLLGPPEKIHKASKDFEALEYYSRGFSIHVTTQRGVLAIMCYTGKFFATQVRDFAGRTDKGIRMGASRAAIEKAYGTPSSVREPQFKDVFGKNATNPEKKTGQVDLSYGALGLSFSLHDDALDSIMLNAPRPAKPATAPPKS
jgi:outer membrane lipoprotein-sorting protein